MKRGVRDVLDGRWSTVRRLLVARLDNAGDVLMCQPALRGIRHALPDCQITLWASPGGALLACLLPEVDGTLVTRALWQDLGHLAFDPRREHGLIQTLADGAYDAAIVFTSFSQSPHPAAYACYLAGIPLRAGQSREFSGAVLTDAVIPPSDECHQVDRNLHLVRALGFQETTRNPEVTIPDAARDNLGLKLRIKGIGLGRPFVLVHPGASCPARRYPLERFAAVARFLFTTLHWPIVFSGSEREKAYEAELLAAAGPGAVSLIGQTRVDEFAALVARSTVVVTNNTLTMHLADALRTPQVVLFSGTEREQQWRPRAGRALLLRRPTPCHPCYRFECPFDLACLDIPPSEVVAKVLQLVPEMPR
jgi:lipopolysaccharide heptosyltransferase II